MLNKQLWELVFRSIQKRQKFIILNQEAEIKSLKEDNIDAVQDFVYLGSNYSNYSNSSSSDQLLKLFFRMVLSTGCWLDNGTELWTAHKQEWFMLFKILTGKPIPQLNSSMETYA